MRLRVAGIIEESVVDGPGLRLVVFVQGCPHRCPGCHNPHTWDPAGGTLMEVEEILAMVKRNPLLKGVTLSGGEPFAQAGALAVLARQVRALGRDVITYTGYTWEKLLELAGRDGAVKELVELSDYIVDGPFIQEKRDPELPFRGSSNQRVIDVPASLACGRVVIAPWGGQ
ncbi:anaerobic ribonucleoside-triphosphate reductase activating protein [Desulfofundulus australicus DSM 11792]|uniref:Anaerobic ribonucleoside-triphosphate reductase-activating protein n=1 Tax=Desulfofundulus australicus DSM 11792 TaxID=1121425 RepID=A0A1M5A1U4_9FIRM|nr:MULTISPECIES: anaerobic ribonucleoside-triphosphate reductase activating protein [Desulfofundulus]MDK2887665.1 anaerobic ribonucleoside-triphosphate reductase activating protein [Thermoanaerobacter sp.]SHF24215.1 anaerobic ribonucleoside-triphosphate reductase activating protein [Desulfofundulus australicus DSM 11792]